MFPFKKAAEFTLTRGHALARLKMGKGVIPQAKRIDLLGPGYSPRRYIFNTQLR